MNIRAAAPEGQRSAPPESPPPDDLTPYGRFVREHDLDIESQLLVMLPAIDMTQIAGCYEMRILAGDRARRDRFTAARSTGRDSPRAWKGE